MPSGYPDPLVRSMISVIEDGLFFEFDELPMSHHEPDPETHLILAGPYRLFFPLGVLNGLLGVGHWALWSVGWIETSEPYFHASIQVQGFLACFVVGFLMTALPRFLGSTSSTRLELSLVLLPALGFTFFSGQYLSLIHI